MSNLVKDIVGSYLKEDLQKVLQKTTELKEDRLSENDLQSRISSIAKMNKLADPNKIYAGKTLNIDGSKYTIKRGDNLTKIARSFSGTSKAPAAQASRPAAPQAAPAPKSSNQYDRPIPGSEPRLPAGRFQSPAVSKATSSSTAEPQRNVKDFFGPSKDLAKDIESMKPKPREPAPVSKATPDYSFVGSKKEMRQGAPMPPPGSPVNAPAVSAVRDFGANPPSSLSQTSKTSNASAPEPKPEPTKTSGIPSAADQMKAIEATPKPDSYVPKAARIGRETATTPAPMNESFVSVGSNKYRIV